MNEQTSQLKIKCVAQVKCITIIQVEFESTPGESRKSCAQRAEERAEQEFAAADRYEVEAIEFEYSLQDK